MHLCATGFTEFGERSMMHYYFMSPFEPCELLLLYPAMGCGTLYAFLAHLQARLVDIFSSPAILEIGNI